MITFEGDNFEKSIFRHYSNYEIGIKQTGNVITILQGLHIID